MTVNDLLSTDVTSVELLLGSQKATAWNVERDGDGNQMVYPSGQTLRTNERDGQFFYRYELDDNKNYLYNEDGSPMLLPVVTAATMSGATNQTQTIALKPGLERVVLFYGYSDAAENDGYTTANGIQITAGMTAAQLEAALDNDTLNGVTDATVTGAGTEANPWIITLNAGTQTPDSKYKQLATRYLVQAYNGSFISRSDSRVAQRFYRLADANGTYLFSDDGNPATADAPVLVERTTAANLIDANRVQFVALESWQLSTTQDSILWYGDNGIVLKSTDTAATVETRLETLISDITDVTVLGAGTAENPYSIEFVTATKSNNKYRQLTVTSGGGILDATKLVTRTTASATTLSSATNARQELLLPVGTTKLTLTYNDQTTSTIDLLAGASAVETALEALSNVTDVSVSAPSDPTKPWIIVIGDASMNGAAAYLIQASVTQMFSSEAAADSALPNNNIQTISFGTSTRGTVKLGQTSIAIHTSMTSAALTAEFKKLEVELTAATISVTKNVSGSNTTYEVTFTGADEGQAFDLLTFQKEETLGAAFGTVAVDAPLPSMRQSLIVSTANALTIFYGDEGIDINAGSFTAADIKAKLEALESIRRVDVSGDGSGGSPFVITIVDADLTAGAFRSIHAETFVQNSATIQATQGGSGAAQFSYSRTNDRSSIATQSIQLRDWETYTTVHYNGESIELTRGMSAKDVENALESLSTIDDVWVSGAGLVTTVSDPQHQRIADQVVAAGLVLKYGSLSYTVLAADIDPNGDDTTASNLETKLRLLGGDLANIDVTYDDDTAEYRFSLTSVTSPSTIAFTTAGIDFQAQLEEVTTFNPWNIVLLDADRDAYGNEYVIETSFAIQTLRSKAAESTAANNRIQTIPTSAFAANTDLTYGSTTHSVTSARRLAVPQLCRPFCER